MSDATTPGDGHSGRTLPGPGSPSKVFDLLVAAGQGHEGPRLETVPARPGLVKASASIECLVSWCPATRQIDYYLPPGPGRGGVEISYAPNGSLVESKSLKLYTEWFLFRAIFAEALAVQIAEDVYAATNAHWVRVQAYQAVRGGIRLIGEAYLPVGTPTGTAAAAQPATEQFA